MHFNFSNKPVLYNIDDVNRVIINILFPVKSSNKESVIRTLLIRLLSSYNMNYTKPNEFYSKLDSLYIIGYSVDTIRFLEITYIRFTLVLPKNGLIDDYDASKAINFFYDSIFKPYTNDKEFDTSIFEYEKNFLLDKEKDFPKSIYEYTGDLYYQFIDKDEKLGLSHDSYMKYLNEVTSSEVYKYYNKNITNNNYMVYIYGNIDDELITCFDKTFNKPIAEFNFDAKFDDYFKFDKFLEKKEKTKYNQSVLYLNYIVKDMCDDDKAYFDTLYFILNSKENALIYNELRTNNNIVYSTKVRSSIHYALFDVIVYYNDYDYKKIIDIVNSTIDSLRDENKFNTCKERLVKSLGYDLLYQEDEPFGKVFEEIEISISDEKSFKEKIELINNIEHKDFVKFLDKVILSKSYLFESGDKNA